MRCIVKRRVGFTLVELLVVIAIIGMLVAILLPAVQSARGAARRSQCQSNLRQLGIAITSHEAAITAYPPGVTSRDEDLRDGMYSGLVNLLPYVEQQTIYDRMDLELDWKTGVNLDMAQQSIAAYLCPESDSTVGLGPGTATDYAFSKGPQAYLCTKPIEAFHGMFDVDSEIKRAHIKDGLSNTIAMGEAASSASLEAFST